MIYNDLIETYAYKSIGFYDIDQKEAISLLAAFLSQRYHDKYKDKIVDFLPLSSDKIACFLRCKEKNKNEKAKAYDEFHKHLIEALSESFSDDINSDIDDSHNDFYSKENHEANEADSRIKQIKEQDDNKNYIKKIFDEAYNNYNKARLQYF